MSDVLLKTPNDIRKFLEFVVSEAVATGEKGRQDQLAFDLEQLRARFPEQVDLDEADEEEKKQRVQQKVEQPPQQQPEQPQIAPEESPEGQGVMPISAKDIMDHLNIIRSGMSLKRGDIKEAMQEYFDNLSDAERLALDSFLEGIASIVTGGERDGDEAKRPEPTVDMNTSVEVDTSHSHSDQHEPDAASAGEYEYEHRNKKKPRAPKPKAKRPRKQKRTGRIEDTTPPISVKR